MKISVIIPVFNEAATIRQIVKRVKASPLVSEIILVDDFSTDGSREIIMEELQSQVSQVVCHDANRGKGASVRSALEKVTGEVVIIQDADLEYDPEEYPRLIKPISNGDAEVVYGSRFMGSEAHRLLYFWHMIGNKFLTLLSNMSTNLNFTDMETCYKVFRKDIIKKIKIEENGFGFEAEITAKIAKLGCRIYEVGISYKGRTYREGKKINWKDGVRTIWCILKYNFLR